MRLIYAVFIPLLVLMTSAQCQQTAYDWYHKGVVFYSQGEYDEAIKSYDEAIRLDLNFALARYNKDNAFKLLGKTSESNAAFAKAK